MNLKSAMYISIVFFGSPGLLLGAIFCLPDSTATFRSSAYNFTRVGSSVLGSSTFYAYLTRFISLAFASARSLKQYVIASTGFSIFVYSSISTKN